MRQISKHVKFISIFLVIFIIAQPVAAIAQQTDLNSDYMQGKIDGEMDAKGNAMWIIAGCGCGLLGVGAAYLMKPSPPAAAIIGKSTEYILAYTEAYQNKARNINLRYACTGYIVTMVAYIILLASLSDDLDAGGY